MLRILTAAVALAVILVGALAIVVDRSAASNRAVAAAQRAQAQHAAAKNVISIFWEEREALGEYLNVHSQALSDKVWVTKQRFEDATVVVRKGTETPEDVALVAEAVAANRRLLAIVEGAYSYLGKRPVQQTLNKLHRADPGVLRPLQRIMNRDTGQFLQEARIAQNTSRDALWVQIACALLALAGTAWFALIAIRLIRRVDVQNGRLVEAERSRAEFTDTVSHELRTPITSIQGYVDLLLDEEGEPLTEEERRQYLTVVQRNTGRLLRLVNDLLLVAQADANKLDLRLERIDLVEIARQAAEAARATADKQGLRLSFDIALAHAPVDADAVRIAQAIDNLVSNAVKFTPAGGKVGIAVSEEAGEVLITVSDTGMGMTQADLARLFERFFRTSAAQAESIQGTGLGLTITKAIVEAHGGAITVRSEPEVGTSFVITLPLRQSLAEEHPSRRETLAVGKAAA